jgi:hypothetical protein
VNLTLEIEFATNLKSDLQVFVTTYKIARVEKVLTPHRHPSLSQVDFEIEGMTMSIRGKRPTTKLNQIHCLSIPRTSCSGNQSMKIAQVIPCAEIPNFTFESVCVLEHVKSSHSIKAPSF